MDNRDKRLSCILPKKGTSQRFQTLKSKIHGSTLKTTGEWVSPMSY